MKIPETSANVGAYYGNEENGQWQPNGVIIDSGVGGGVVGSGDAGIHRPSVYPVHIPRGHIPGYVMAGAYYPPAAYPPPAPVPPPQDDFADYMWMENEEEFDKQVMQQLEEEALMEQCIEAMLEDEQRERHRPQHNGHSHYPTTSNGNPSLSLEEAVSRSTLNPLAAEFVPTRARPPTQPTEDKEETSPEVAASQHDAQSTKDDDTSAQSTTESKPHVTEDSKTEEPLSPSTDTPEVSAADLSDKRPKDKRDPKKPQKTDLKKAKPQTVKSDTKVQAKKREVKNVKSEMKVELEDAPVLETIKPQQSPTEEPVPSGPKPINYAAAAKANKPKKPTTSPPPLTLAEKTPPKTERVDKIKKTENKTKSDKPIQRKNSNK